MLLTAALCLDAKPGTDLEEGTRPCNHTGGSNVSCLVTVEWEPRNDQSAGWHLGAGLRTAAPKGARDIKILSGGHFIFAAYDTETGKPLYAAGGTYVLNGSSYTEHMDFADDKISAGLIGRDQSFTVEVDGDTFTQTGTLSNGKPLSERWKRIG